jgi:tetratricopeptide (TPR) repeat protein
MESARSRHFEYFSGLAADMERALRGDGQAMALARLELDHENLLAALAWREARADGGRRALGLASKLWRFWYAHGHGRLGLVVLQRLLSREGMEASGPERIEALLGAGLLALDLGDYVACRSLYEEALALASERGDQSEIARALNGLGAVTGDGEGNYERAIEHFQRSLALNRALGNKRAEGIVLSNLGEAALRLGNLAEARALCQESLRLRREVGDKQGIGITQLNAALASVRLGDPRAASRQLAEALALAQELGQRPLGANALDACAEFVVSFGDLHLSTLLAGAADALREGAGSRQATVERAEGEALRDRLRGTLGEDRYAATLREGRDLSFEAALALALRALEPKGASTDLTR